MSKKLYLEITIDWDNYEDVNDELILEDSGLLDSIKDGVKAELVDISSIENIKMFLFARWISTCYADEHKDENGNYRCKISKDSTYYWITIRKDGYSIIRDHIWVCGGSILNYTLRY